MNICVLLNYFFIWNTILFESIKLDDVFMVRILLILSNVLDHMVVHLYLNMDRFSINILIVTIQVSFFLGSNNIFSRLALLLIMA
jgi:hypothetical protein